MEEKLTYKGNFTKADVVEIYCKTIANLGPANILFGKNFSYDAKIDRDAPLTGMAGYAAVGYLRGLHGYIAVQVICCQDPPEECSMERKNFGSDRRITLENIDDKTIVTVSDSPRGMRKVKKVLDQVLA